MRVSRTLATAVFAAAAVILLMAATLQDRKGESPVDKEHRTTWEYKVRSLEDSKPDAEKTFNELGREGWEFVGAYRAPGSTNQFAVTYDYAVFKRPSAK
jgi:hypothetical protein